jgi:nicotinate dehydrogenase subunit A
MAIALQVNGRTEYFDVDLTTPILYVLSDDLGLRGPMFGCGLGQCGACTVIARGRAIRSCVTPISTVEGADIVTLEGLGSPEKPHPIQQAFIDEQAAQCGFCLSGVILTAKALLDQNPKADDAAIRQGMANVRCRCFVHARMYNAIKRYARGRTA